MRLGAIRMMGHAGWPTPPAVALLLASLKQPGHPWWTKADTHQSRYLSAVVLHSGISLCQNGGCQPILVLSKPFAGGYEPNPTRPIKSQSGPIKNQSGGLDSGIITSIELSTPRRQHLAT